MLLSGRALAAQPRCPGIDPRQLPAFSLSSIFVTSKSIPYSGKLSREKTFANFTVLWLFAKVFSAKFGGMASFRVAKRAIREKFSP